VNGIAQRSIGIERFVITGACGVGHADAVLANIERA
jgi:hypothetical protein